MASAWADEPGPVSAGARPYRPPYPFDHHRWHAQQDIGRWQLVNSYRDRSVVQEEYSNDHRNRPTPQMSLQGAVSVAVQSELSAEERTLVVGLSCVDLRC